MKKYLLSAALAGAFCSPSVAGSLTYDSYTWQGVNINITSPNAINGGAGPITLYDKGSVVASNLWCMDVNNYLLGGATVGVIPGTLANLDSGLPGVPTDLTAKQLLALGWLVKQGDQQTEDFLKGVAQVAIWSEEYGSAFQYDSLGANFALDVQADLDFANDEANAGNSSNLALSFFVPGEGVSSQTLIGGTATSAPEPSTWAMGIIGFAVLGAVGWRRNSKSHMRSAGLAAST